MNTTVSNNITVLVTGATGYIGGRLVPMLVKNGYRVRVLVRDARRIIGKPWARHVDVVEGDLESPEAASKALDGVHTAYYLVHSMQAGSDFAKRDRRAAENFIAAGKLLKHVIYLGGLLPGADGRSASIHLDSRREVGAALRAWLPTTEFRAGPVIGSGSASFEMVRYLTERLPLMVAPRWVNNSIQCIGIKDILAYLVVSLDVGPSGVVEVGGNPLTFKQMMLEYAGQRGLKRTIVPVPVLTPGLAAEWIQFVTPISRNMAVPIVKGMIHPLLADTRRAQELFPGIVPAPYSQCVKNALAQLSAGAVETHWNGAVGAPANRLTHSEGLAHDVCTQWISAERQAVFSQLAKIGGHNGWPADNWIWKLRGMVDKLVGGPGHRRGRRDPESLLEGDSLDFWRVEEIRDGELLRLRAEMKLPGQAWLQWELVDELAGCRLVQSAIFAPAGLTGWLYWSLLYPIHRIMFARLIRAIRDQAENSPDPPNSIRRLECQNQGLSTSAE